MANLHFAIPAWDISIRGEIDEGIRHLKLSMFNGAGKTTLLRTIRQKHPHGHLEIFLGSKTEHKELLAAREQGEIFEGFETWTNTDHLLPGKFDLASPSDFRDFIWTYWGEPIEVEEETLDPVEAVQVLRKSARTYTDEARFLKLMTSRLRDLFALCPSGSEQFENVEYESVQTFLDYLIKENQIDSLACARNADALKRRQQVIKDAIAAKSSEISFKVDAAFEAVNAGVAARPQLKATLAPETHPRRLSQGFRQALKLSLLAAAARELDGTVTILLDDEEQMGTTITRFPEWPDNCRIIQAVPGFNTIEGIR